MSVDADAEMNLDLEPEPMSDSDLEVDSDLERECMQALALAPAAQVAPASNFSKIKLLDPQVVHVENLTRILAISPFALDMSSLGSGKTFTSSFIALREPERFKHVIVIAPVSVKVKWQQMAKDYGVPVSAALSYCELRSVKCKQPKHGLLNRRDYTVQMQDRLGIMRNVDKCDFSVSEKYTKMVAEGVLLVVDEIQNVKNVNSQFLACQALIKYICQQFDFSPTQNTFKSRVLMLSGSPIDKMDQATHMFRTLNIMKRERLAYYNFRTHQTVWEGMQDIVDYAFKVNKSDMDDLVLSYRSLTRMHMLRDTAVSKCCYNIFQQVIKPAISSAMPPPNLGLQITKANGYYHILDDDEAILLRDAVFNLGAAASFTNQTLNENRGIQSLRAISAAMSQIETAKIGTFVRIAREALENNPQQKVALCVNYSATIADLVHELSIYSPLVLDGSVNVKKRGEILRKFQDPSTVYRLIIGNVSVMSTGIDLDDKDGRFPRIAFVSPNYSSINLYQLGFRFLRADSKSPSEMYFVYGSHAREQTILAKLAAKSNIMKETTPEQVAQGIVFPNDHVKFEEPVPPGFTSRDPPPREPFRRIRPERRNYASYADTVYESQSDSD